MSEMHADDALGFRTLKGAWSMLRNVGYTSDAALDFSGPVNVHAAHSVRLEPSGDGLVFADGGGRFRASAESIRGGMRCAVLEIAAPTVDGFAVCSGTTPIVSMGSHAARACTVHGDLLVEGKLREKEGGAFITTRNSTTDLRDGHTILRTTDGSPGFPEARSLSVGGTPVMLAGRSMVRDLKDASDVVLKTDTHVAFRDGCRVSIGQHDVLTTASPLDALCGGKGAQIVLTSMPVVRFDTEDVALAGNRVLTTADLSRHSILRDTHEGQGLAPQRVCGSPWLFEKGLLTCSIGSFRAEAALKLVGAVDASEASLSWLGGRLRMAQDGARDGTLCVRDPGNDDVLRIHTDGTVEARRLHAIHEMRVQGAEVLLRGKAGTKDLLDGHQLLRNDGRPIDLQSPLYLSGHAVVTENAVVRTLENARRVDADGAWTFQGPVALDGICTRHLAVQPADVRAHSSTLRITGKSACVEMRATHGAGDTVASLQVTQEGLTLSDASKGTAWATFSTRGEVHVPGSLVIGSMRLQPMTAGTSTSMELADSHALLRATDDLPRVIDAGSWEFRNTHERPLTLSGADGVSPLRIFSSGRLQKGAAGIRFEISEAAVRVSHEAGDVVVVSRDAVNVDATFCAEHVAAASYTLLPGGESLPTFDDSVFQFDQADVIARTDQSLVQFDGAIDALHVGCRTFCIRSSDEDDTPHAACFEICENASGASIRSNSCLEIHSETSTAVRVGSQDVLDVSEGAVTVAEGVLLSLSSGTNMVVSESSGIYKRSADGKTFDPFVTSSQIDQATLLRSDAPRTQVLGSWAFSGDGFTVSPSCRAKIVCADGDSESGLFFGAEESGEDASGSITSRLDGPLSIDHRRGVSLCGTALQVLSESGRCCVERLDAAGGTLAVSKDSVVLAERAHLRMGSVLWAPAEQRNLGVSAIVDGDLAVTLARGEVTMPNAVRSPGNAYIDQQSPQELSGLKHFAGGVSVANNVLVVGCPMDARDKRSTSNIAFRAADSAGHTDFMSGPAASISASVFAPRSEDEWEASIGFDVAQCREITSSRAMTVRAHVVDVHVPLRLRSDLIVDGGDVIFAAENAVVLTSENARKHMGSSVAWQDGLGNRFAHHVDFLASLAVGELVLGDGAIAHGSKRLDFAGEDGELSISAPKVEIRGGTEGDPADGVLINGAPPMLAGRSVIQDLANVPMPVQGYFLQGLPMGDSAWVPLPPVTRLSGWPAPVPGACLSCDEAGALLWEERDNAVVVREMARMDSVHMHGGWSFSAIDVRSHCRLEVGVCQDWTDVSRGIFWGGELGWSSKLIAEGTHRTVLAHIMPDRASSQWSVGVRRGEEGFYPHFTVTSEGALCTRLTVSGTATVTDALVIGSSCGLREDVVTRALVLEAANTVWARADASGVHFTRPPTVGEDELMCTSVAQAAFLPADREVVFRHAWTFCDRLRVCGGSSAGLSFVSASSVPTPGDVVGRLQCTAPCFHGRQTQCAEMAWIQTDSPTSAGSPRADCVFRAPTADASAMREVLRVAADGRLSVLGDVDAHSAAFRGQVVCEGDMTTRGALCLTRPRARGGSSRATRADDLECLEAVRALAKGVRAEGASSVEYDGSAVAALRRVGCGDVCVDWSHAEREAVLEAAPGRPGEYELRCSELPADNISSVRVVWGGESVEEFGVTCVRPGRYLVAGRTSDRCGRCLVVSTAVVDPSRVTVDAERLLLVVVRALAWVARESSSP